MQPEKPPKRTEKLQAVATVQEVEDFRTSCEALGLGPSDTLRRLAASFVNQVREKKSVRVPLKIELK